MLEICYVAEQLLVTQEGLRPMELFYSLQQQQQQQLQNNKQVQIAPLIFSTIDIIPRSLTGASENLG
jgi:hypothetical protein